MTIHLPNETIEYECHVRLAWYQYESFTVSLILPDWVGQDINDEMRALITRQIVEFHPDNVTESAVLVVIGDDNIDDE